MKNKITPFLMFEGNAEKTMNDYIGIFESSEINSIVRYKKGEAGIEGTVIHASFRLNGQEFICIDNAIQHEFTFTPAISLFINCGSEDELIKLFDKLSEGGEVLMPPGSYGFSKKLGWVNDQFRVSWQLNLE